MPARLILIISLLFCSHLAVASEQEGWVQTTTLSVSAVKSAYSAFVADRDDSALLSGLLIELNSLSTPVQRCIDTNRPLLDEIKLDIEQLETISTEEDSAASKALEEIRQREDAIQARLITCKSIKLDIESLASSINKTQQDILARLLLAKEKNLLRLLIDNALVPGAWLRSLQAYLQDRMEVQVLTPENWGLVLLSLIAGIVLGRKASQKLTAVATRIDSDETSILILQSLASSFSRSLPVLLPVIAILVPLTLMMALSPIPFSVAAFTIFASYLLISPSIAAFLNPAAPARHFLSLDKDYCQYLSRRLQVLLVLAHIILLVIITDLDLALDRDQWLLVRSILLVLTGINLIWLLSMLNRVPGLLGSTLVRGLVITLLLASIVAESLGYHNLALYVFKGLTGTAGLAIALWLANTFLTDVFDGLDEGRHIWQQNIRNRLRLKKDEPLPGLVWLRALTMLATWTVFAFFAFRLWGYSSANWSTLLHVLTDGFEVGEFRIVPLKLAIAIIVFSLLITTVRWFRQQTLPNWLTRTRLDHGAREAVISISGYIGIILAALLGLSLAGFDFTNIAIIAGALSVGIGFGLQNIVNNFISGIILLFERPIRTGDWIVVGTTEGYVRKISIRSTQIETFDRSDVIVPNSELISNQVTNWMLRDPWGRVIVPVGVAYGSDVGKVSDILLEVASEHPLVLTENPKVGQPRVLFRGFGDSSLNFELRCFIRNVDKRLSTLSDLNFAIDKAFRENNIEIPFPQRDIHIRTPGNIGHDN